MKRHDDQVRSTSEAALRALNPVGMVPVIDDGGTIIWESGFVRHGRDAGV